MNKNISGIILIVLAIGIYFTFTKDKIEELKTIAQVNGEYQKAIDNSTLLFKKKEEVIKQDINISAEDTIKLNKLLPDNVDNVRLIIDVKDNIAKARGLTLKGIKTSSPSDSLVKVSANIASEDGMISFPTDYGTVTLSFSVTTTYQNFIDFMKDLEASLRLMDISRLSVTTSGTGTGTGNYDFNVEIKTYWLKQ